VVRRAEVCLDVRRRGNAALGANGSDETRAAGTGYWLAFRLIRFAPGTGRFAAGAGRRMQERQVSAS
jgi:hypothetical protein